MSDKPKIIIVGGGLAGLMAAIKANETGARVQLFSLVPVAVGFGLTWRTWAPRPGVTVGLMLLGTTALGSLVVHLSCPILDGRHVLLGHCSAPLLMAALGGAVLARWMRRWAR